MAFIDLMVLLTEGRGGRFVERGDGALRYLPSGFEPHLVAGSRRGVPYHAKLTYRLQGARPQLPRFLDNAAVASLLATGASVDFRADVGPSWPRKSPGGTTTSCLPVIPSARRGPVGLRR